MFKQTERQTSRVFLLLDDQLTAYDRLWKYDALGVDEVIEARYDATEDRESIGRTKKERHLFANGADEY